MDLRHLQTFITIAEEGSFVQAAEKLQYAQSTITVQMQQLEKELNLELFNRQHKKVRLTLAGQSLLSHAIHVLGQVERMQQELHDLAAGESGTLRVGIVEPIAQLQLPTVIETFSQNYPHVHLVIETFGTIRIAECVATGELDLGFSTLPFQETGLLFDLLMNEPMVLLLAQEHPLNHCSMLSLSDLVHERILLSNPPCAYRTAVEQAFLARGMPMPMSIELGSLATLKQCVLQGVGIALMPHITAYPLLEGIVIRTLADWDLHLPFGFITRSSPVLPRKAVLAFATLLKNTLKNRSICM